MRGNRRLFWTLLVSVLLHGLLLSVFVEPPVEPPKERILDLVIVEEPIEEPVEESVVPVEPVEVEPPTEARIEAIAEVPPEPGPVTELEVPVEVAAPPAGTVLNLRRPDNWDELIDRIPDPDVKLEFNVDLKERVAARETDKRRQRLVAGRVASVYGVSDDDYTRIGARGTQMKRDGGCVTLVEDKFVEEGARWWPGQCTETKANPFTLVPIEISAVGQAVAD
jgi:hypothetical protein